MFNETSLDTLCGALAYAMGIDAPEQAAAPNETLTKYIDDVLQGKKVDRIFMYNPDAVPQWINEKYPHYTQEICDCTDLALPLRTVMPSVTPVCFGTMYTGAQPEVHGIQKYDKPVITIDTLFDAMIRAGKKCLIIANTNCSLDQIYRNRDMDYISVKNHYDINAAAAKAILEDKYDFIVCYNGNYDYWQHRFGPEAPEALAELKFNSITATTFLRMIQENWGSHNTLFGFAMDHGSHEVPAFEKRPGLIYRGTHGDEIPEDLNIVHRYQIIPATK